MQPLGTNPMNADDTGIFRVTVRGQFRELTGSTRERLAAAAPDHDIFLAAYTAEGTFTYDERLQFFNLRYEVRGVRTAAEADARALSEAETFLRVLGIDHHPLRSTVVDMIEMMTQVRDR